MADLESSMRQAAEQVAQYVKDAATMEVRTYYVLVGAADVNSLGSERPGAFTRIKLDGDNQTIVPMRKGQGEGLELDSTLFDIHQRNVATATEYRASVLNALIGLLQRGR